MAKKKSKEYNKVWNAFQTELTDGELQHNFDEFAAKSDELAPEYEDMFIHHQKMENEIAEIKDAILLSAINSISSEALNRKLRDLESAAEELEDEMNVIYAKIKHYDELLNKYQDWSERKLFVWWTVFTALDDTTPDWMKWKAKYIENII
jgi:chaperonin cofactor prefoldin